MMCKCNWNTRRVRVIMAAGQLSETFCIINILIITLLIYSKQIYKQLHWFFLSLPSVRHHSVAAPASLLTHSHTHLILPFSLSGAELVSHHTFSFSVFQFKLCNYLDNSFFNDFQLLLFHKWEMQNTLYFERIKINWLKLLCMQNDAKPAFETPILCDWWPKWWIHRLHQFDVCLWDVDWTEDTLNHYLFQR